LKRAGALPILPDKLISLRGVEVHNLKHIDLDLPHGKLIVFCGLSGSGKTSLALDTLYAEGQRRYIESFSAYTRQFLERLEKPAAEKITGIPPAIAVTHKHTSRSNRSTVGTATETNDYLRLLYAKIGRVFCSNDGVEVRRDTPQSAARQLAALPEGVRYLITAPPETLKSSEPLLLADELKQRGFVRAIVDSRTIHLAEEPIESIQKTVASQDIAIVIDRLAGGMPQQRLRDSLETAFNLGAGSCTVLVEDIPPSPSGQGAAVAARGAGGEGTSAAGATAGCSELAVASLSSSAFAGRGKPLTIDDRPWLAVRFDNQMRCTECGREYLEPEPRLFSFNSPLGACPQCEGFGNIIDIDMDLVVPDPKRTLREGAVAPWTTPAYEHEYKELAALAKDYDVPLDVPFANLTEPQKQIIIEGVPERKFGGLRGFFAWLERRKYKMHLRVFLSRWRSPRPCPACQGARLRPESLAVVVGGKNIGQVAAMKVRDARAFFRGLKLEDWELAIARMLLDQIDARLRYLETVGLDYLTLDRSLKTLSGGELERVSLTSALGSSLVGMLYVLDEPTVGLHPADVNRLVDAVHGLRNRGNTVVVVEHEEAMIRSADQIVEIGPGAGERGGQVVFQGPPAQIVDHPTSTTGDFLAGRRGIAGRSERRPPDHGWLRIAGASGHNLKNVTVEFPLGMLCLVTGVSGAGKSTLVQDTLYPALRRRMKLEAPVPLPYRDVFGDGQIDDVLLVDQSPIGRSPRSNPVTYIKAFDEIRAVFADTLEARTRNYTASHFSFNVDGGRCPKCEGDGYLAVDMQFLADVYMKCPECHGRRYRKEILKVTYRGRNIAEVLEMTVREAFTFFRGSPKVQSRLKQLIDVGLDYLRLGQPANTLSGGEAQRLKLAGYMSAAKRSRTLFILDEPTTGLHFADVTQLLDCFDALVAVGHSLIVIEHNMQMMRAADWLIDLGPGAADEGGQLVATGTPEEIARNPRSTTGRLLKEALKAKANKNGE
jgi:excinuclease ABC subunit A